MSTPLQDNLSTQPGTATATPTTTTTTTTPTTTTTTTTQSTTQLEHDQLDQSQPSNQEHLTPTISNPDHHSPPHQSNSTALDPVPTISLTPELPPSESTNPNSDLPSDQTPPQLANVDHQPISLSPQLSELASMFPQIQPSILEAVLAAHANDPSACVSDLLAMSDPNWKPSSQDVMAQSDAELARQLAFQESNQHLVQPPAQAQQMNLPYQPRIKKPAPLRPPQPWQQDSRAEGPETSGLSPSGKDEIQKIAEELGKLAETGKKTVSSWLNKAKSKMQEMQQPAISPPPENFNAYEHVSPPSPNELATGTRPAAGSSTARSSRISPALPYASRYETPTARATPPPSTRSIGSTAGSKVEGYKIDESGSTGVVAVGPKEGSSAHTPVAGNQKAREDDEESLEYTRNPFEDED